MIAVCVCARACVRAYSSSDLVTLTYFSLSIGFDTIKSYLAVVTSPSPYFLSKKIAVIKLTLILPQFVCHENVVCFISAAYILVH